MSNYDQDVLGVGNPMHPANQIDIADEEITLDEAISDVKENISSEVAQTIEDHIYFLELDKKSLIERNRELKRQLTRLAIIDEAMIIFGKITYEQNVERKSILQQHHY